MAIFQRTADGSLQRVFITTRCNGCGGNSESESTTSSSLFSDQPETPAAYDPADANNEVIDNAS